MGATKMGLFTSRKNQSPEKNGEEKITNRLVVVDDSASRNTPKYSVEQLSAAFAVLCPEYQVLVVEAEGLEQITFNTTDCVICLLPSPTTLVKVLEKLFENHDFWADNLCTCLVTYSESDLISIGQAFTDAADRKCFGNVRLMAHRSIANYLEGSPDVGLNQRHEAIASELRDMLAPVSGPAVISMPVSTELADSPKRHIYSLSPLMRDKINFIRALCLNNVSRIYLLGAPGTGKTSLAYYYWLCRDSGRFVSVNLSSEVVDSKEALKSLLCGHVTGAMGGSGAREGALAFAEDGVAFIDESHALTGKVFSVLMEVLDSEQFLPFGSTHKRALKAAVIFASNRSWDSLTENIHLDEHARLGATIIEIPDLSKRKEDIVAIVASLLWRFSGKCSTWQAPAGFDQQAWDLIWNATWKGNVRALLRVVETAAIHWSHEHSSKENHRLSPPIIDSSYVKQALYQWEPESHPDDGLYATF